MSSNTFICHHLGSCHECQLRDAAIKKLAEDMIREIYGLANYDSGFHIESGKRFFDRKAKLWPEKQEGAV
jgi:hypothetical protein